MQVLLVIFIFLCLLTALLTAIFNYVGRPREDPNDEGFFLEQRYGKVTTSLNIATAVFAAVSGLIAVAA